MSGFAIKSITPQKWAPSFSPKAVGLHGGWSPATLPQGPADKIQETLGIAMASDPDVALGQAAARAMAAGSIALLTVPSAAVAYVGYRLGTLDKGFPSILGYIVGTVGALGVLAGVLGMLGAIALPTGMAGETQSR